MKNEQDLVRKAQAGNERAFEELVSLYETKIYHMALRYTGDPQEALDISQEVFLRMFRAIGKFEGNSSFSTWLYRIADNVCKDALRRSVGRRTVSLDQQDEEESYSLEIPDLRYNPESVYDRAAMREAIVDGISALPENLREILILRDISGMSYEEISQCLDLELGTVKSRIARSREKLRGFLSQNGNKKQPAQSNETKGGSSR